MKATSGMILSFIKIEKTMQMMLLELTMQTGWQFVNILKK
jgi:hypothetical protein